MQSEEEARAIETAVRTAVLSVVDVINNIYTSRLVDYQRKVAEKDKENALLKAEVVRTEKELACLRRLAGSQDEDVRSPNTAVHENLFLVATHVPPTGPFQSNVKQSKKPVSAAERQRLYRARRDADPRRRVEYLESEKKRWMNDMLLGKRKRIQECSLKEKRAIRRRWRLAKEKSRASKVSSQLQEALSPEQSPPQYSGANTEFQYECLDTTASSPRDVHTGSPPSVCSPSWDSEGQVDFVDRIDFPLVKEEFPSPDSVYIKCEVKEENTSDFLEDTSTDQYHSDPHSTWTLDRETPENCRFTHQPSEVRAHPRGSSRGALWGHGRLGCSVSRRGKKKHDGNRESSRRYREKIRADPVKYQAYLEQEKRRYQQRKKLIHELPEEKQRQRRELWREATRKTRAKKKYHTEQWTQPL